MNNDTQLIIRSAKPPDIRIIELVYKVGEQEYWLGVLEPGENIDVLRIKSFLDSLFRQIDNGQTSP